MTIGNIHYTADSIKNFAKSKKFHQNTENILFYSKKEGWYGSHIWNEVMEPN